MKQTLEEASEQYAKSKSSSSVFQKAHIRDFISGAKWMQERMYSEEEVLNLVDNLFHKYSFDFRVNAQIDTKEYLEHFKK